MPSIRETHRYAAFGLGLRSELPLPELRQSKGDAPDVEIRYGRVDAPELADAPPTGCSTVRDAIAYLAWADGGRFRVRGGAEIVMDPDADALPERLRVFVLGPAIGVLLHQRGRLVLHASAVTIDGGAVAFIGPKRSGKSTLAAALHARGHELISDDVLALDLAEGADPRVLPGVPQLKLWPDSLDLIGRDPAGLPRLHPALEKRDYRLESRFAAERRPLRAVFVLGPDHAPGIRRMDGADVLSQLIAHWYCARYGYETLAALGISSHFVKSAELARRVPFYTVTRPAALADTPELAERIEAKVTGEAPAPSGTGAGGAVAAAGAAARSPAGRGGGAC